MRISNFDYNFNTCHCIGAAVKNFINNIIRLKNYFKKDGGKYT